MNQQPKKGNEGWKHVIQTIVFDKAVWMLAALCVMGWLYWQKAQRVPAKQPFEFSFLQMAKDSRIDSEIQAELISLLHRNKADRAYIMQFHNGGELAGGNPFRKMSCCYEEVTLGTSRELATLQDIPLSAIPECINELANQPNAFIKRVDEIKCGMEKALLIRRGDKASVYKRLNVKNKLIGYIALNYVRSSHLTDTNAMENIEKVLNDVNSTAGFFELELEKK